MPSTRGAGCLLSIVFRVALMALAMLCAGSAGQAQAAGNAPLPSLDFTQAQAPVMGAAGSAETTLQSTPAGLQIDSRGEDSSFTLSALDFPVGAPLIVRVRARSESDGPLQIFYYPEGGGASEAKSVKIAVRSGRWETLWAKLPALGPHFRIRIDPPGKQGRTVIPFVAFQSQAALLASAGHPPTAEGRVLANDMYRIVVAEDGSVASWQARLAPASPLSPNLVQRLSWAGDTVPAGGWHWTQTSEALRAVNDAGDHLTVMLHGPQVTYALHLATPGAATLRAEVPFVNSGYLDRRSGRNLSPNTPPLGGLTGFTSLVSGKIVTMERLKRSTTPVEMDAREGQSVRMATHCGFEIDATAAPSAQAVRFQPDFVSLVITQDSSAQSEHRFTARVQPVSQTVTLRSGHRIPRFSVSPDRTIVNSAGARFSLNALLADFYHETAFWWQTGNSGIWSDWTAIEHGFADTSYRDDFRASLLGWIVGDDGYSHDGYAYTWGNQRGWPFPTGVDTRHLDSNAVLINAAWRLYSWTGDKTLLTTQSANTRPEADPPTRPDVTPARDTLLGKMRRAMQYQLLWWNGASEGIIHASGKDGDTAHNGLPGKGVGSNYYDIMPFGGKDAYASVQFYLSLRSMAEVEQQLGNPKRAAFLRGLMPQARAAFNQAFWLERKGNGDGASRYAGAVDSRGTVQDYGFTFVNTMAMEAGLASPTQARAIYDWLDYGVSIGPQGERNHDIYAKWKFGARSSTVFNPDWWAYSVGKWPWNDQLQNGGADLYEAGYDIISRARYQGPDKAWQRYAAMLTRYAEPDRLSGGGILGDGSKVQGGDSGAGSVGVMFSEFPECGVASASFLYAFLGVNVGVDGLRLTPQVPTTLHSVRAENIAFRGAVFTLEASRAAGQTVLHIQCTGNPHSTTFFINGKPQAARFDVRIPIIGTRAVILSDSR